ncbi:hypothetical protein Mal48_25520 [Thalassoglobus polymorphus]|uniref:Uncharacterized protein n=1 Tax=Thalassoglobus polymorphus TaxID=2527994 RepID=A0A517QNU2_9PLAN|nr:hypothetical protein Mal48_25520 [Thalassoglobus polymorphus]
MNSKKSSSDSSIEKILGFATELKPKFSENPYFVLKACQALTIAKSYSSVPEKIYAFISVVPCTSPEERLASRPRGTLMKFWSIAPLL